MATSLWFADNKDKAWAEKFFLIYSPVWMALMGIMMLTGWDKSFGNIPLLLHAMLVALPLVLVPAFLHHSQNKKNGTDIRWHDSYWFKANLYIFIFGFFGNYFGTEYFFDVLGMVYNYPNASSTLDSALLGSGEQTVPLIMYFYTHAYFMTYHSSAIVVLRKIMTSSIPAKTVLFLPIVFVIGYVWAWAETKAMANPLMATSFYYENMAAMLAYGSVIYATYFVASFPIYYFINEKQQWDNAKVTAAAFSASMLTFYMLDIAAHLVNRL